MRQQRISDFNRKAMCTCCSRWLADALKQRHGNLMHCPPARCGDALVCNNASAYFVAKCWARVAYNGWGALNPQHVSTSVITRICVKLPFQYTILRASMLLLFNNWSRPRCRGRFHFTIPRASKVLCFCNQNRRRRKVRFHFTIPRASKVLCFYNQNRRHRKVGMFSI